jgi:tetratricopeptide (TPR) repeat protein
MPATLRRFAIAIPVTLLLSVACWGQTTAFEGDVKGADGKPMVKVMVHLDRKDIKGSYKVNTDKKGHYYYGGLPIGTYKIWVEVDGKEKDFVDNAKSGLGDAKVINFDMSKSAAQAGDRQAEMKKTIESGGELTKEQTRDMTPEQKAALEKRIKDAQAQMSKNKALNDAFNAGKAAMEAKQFDVAIENLEKAKEMDPSQNVIWGNLADAYAGAAKTKVGAEQQPLLEKGMEAYKKAIELKPDDAAYHNNYALLLAQARKTDEALAELTKAAQLDPPRAGQYYFNGGAVLVNLGQNEAAGVMFKKAIDGDANYAEAHYQYGLTLYAKATTAPDGKIVPPDGTREEFQKYLELKPNCANAEASAKPECANAETAKAMLQSMGATLETEFSKPGAKKQTTKKKP